MLVKKEEVDYTKGWGATATLQLIKNRSTYANKEIVHLFTQIKKKSITDSLKYFILLFKDPSSLPIMLRQDLLFVV